MDSKGNWHYENEQHERRRGRLKSDQNLREINEGIGSIFPSKRVITLRIGSPAKISLADGSFVKCVFESAENNRATFAIPDGAPYFEFGSTVTISNDEGEKATGNIWDNRGGKLVIRTTAVNV